MKLLVFEYINGGGFAGQIVPPSLLREGTMMLQALLHELNFLADVQLIVPLDHRCHHLQLPPGCRVVWIDDADTLYDTLSILLRDCDAFWPIAPESNGILSEMARLAADKKFTLLLSDADTVDVCSDKLMTYKTLVAANIPSVETLPLLERQDVLPFESIVVKPIDGAGCEGNRVFREREQYRSWLHALSEPASYVAQPLMQGEAKSWSVLFKAGRGWLLCCNRQIVGLGQQGFSLEGCQVNIDVERFAIYQSVIDGIARALPGLWGYVGIDFIDSDVHGPLILEVNPRLTTSYAGILRATTINVAEQVLRLPHTDPCLPQLIANTHLVSIT